MVLYKYYPVDRVSVLTEYRIYFTRPQALNDPFEGCFDVRLPPSEQELALTPWFARLVAEARTRDAERAIPVALDSLVVLSLSSRPDSLLMWSHYADWHAGFVIGIDVDHAAVAHGPFRHLAQVRYLQDRPDPHVGRQVVQDELLLAKSVEWHYEAEWRMVDSCFAAIGRPPVESPDSWPFALPPESVREVVVGCRTGQASIDALNRALGSSDYAHVRRFRAETDARKFRLNVLPA